MSTRLEELAGEERIVVGVNGSPSSKAALASAARQAELTSTRLVVFTTFPVTRAL